MVSSGAAISRPSNTPFATFPKSRSMRCGCCSQSVVFLIAMAFSPDARPRRRARTAARLTRREWSIGRSCSAIVGTVLYQLFFLAGVARTSVANSALIFGCTPVAVAIMASVAGHERLSPARWMGAASVVRWHLRARRPSRDAVAATLRRRRVCVCRHAVLVALLGPCATAAQAALAPRDHRMVDDHWRGTLPVGGSAADDRQPIGAPSRHELGADGGIVAPRSRILRTWSGTRRSRRSAVREPPFTATSRRLSRSRLRQSGSASAIGGAQLFGAALILSGIAVSRLQPSP